MLSGLALVGCRSPQGSEPERAIDPVVATEMGYTVSWVSDVEVPSGHDLAHAVVLDDLLVTVESPTSLVTALSMRDGSIEWRRKVGEPAERLFEPFRRRGQILVNSSDHLYRLEVDSGELIGFDRLDWAATTEPAIVGELAIFGALNGRVFAHDLDAGFMRWQYQMKGAIRVAPRQVNEALFVADTAGRYALIDPADGSLRWDQMGRAFSGITAAPAVTDRAILMPSLDHSLYAVHPGDGRDRWVYRTTVPLDQSPAAFGSRVYLPIPGKALVALDLLEGTERWRLEKASLTPLTRVGEQLLARAPSALVLIDPASGRVTREVELGPLAQVVPLAGEEGGLILASPEGRVTRLDRIPTPEEAGSS